MLKTHIIWTEEADSRENQVIPKRKWQLQNLIRKCSLQCVGSESNTVGGQKLNSDSSNITKNGRQSKRNS